MSTTHTAETNDGDVIDVAMEIGFYPADDEPAPDWMTGRYAHYGVLPTSYGFLVFDITEDDESMKLTALTSTGVTIDDVDFRMTPMGLRMFAACAREMAL